MSDEETKVSRRTVLKVLGAAVSTATVGCEGGTVGALVDASDANASDATDAGADDAGSDAARDAASDATLDAARDAASDARIDGGRDASAPNTCAETSTKTPSELLAPIDTIVVLMMENRSFDHYLGSLRFREGRLVDGLVGSEQNPAPNGQPVTVFQLNDFTPADPPHGWDACHRQWNFGANDGFVKEHEGPSQNDVMGYHVREQLPILYALADAGAICERWYSSVMGPTWPNRFYLHGATSKGIKSNLPILFGNGYTSIFERLGAAGISHANYFHDIPWALGGYQKTSGNRGIDQFFTDAANGTLPSFSIVDPQFFGAGANDDHPDHDVQLGQALIATIYAALAASPQWNKCLFVITYDEHGGFYDHVDPPTVYDEQPEFRQYGFRVPSLVLGPYVRRGCVVGTGLEHVSVLKTLQTRFGIAPLNSRMDVANDLSSCIAPSTLGAPLPPSTLPVLSLSNQKLLARPASNAHQELADVIARMDVPAGLDRRSTGIGQTAHVLRWGQELGVLRVR